MITAIVFSIWLTGSLLTLISLVRRFRVGLRRTFAYISVILFGVGAIVALLDTGWLAYIASLVLLLNAINANRVISDRYPEKVLARVVVKDMAGLALIWLTLLSLLVLVNSVDGAADLKTTYYFCLLVANLALLINALRSVFAFRYKPVEAEDAKSSVSLAIAARNETHALADTLRSVVKSTYPKLETLVLDDCSQDSTPELIKSFAGDGIRFVQGEKPTSGWLGKNYAYETLLKESSGEYILVAVTDVHYEPESIAKMVAYAEKNKLDMLCVLPQKTHFDPVALLTQPLRFYWQLSLPSWLRHASPVSSSCSLIKKSFLNDVGGFEKFSGSIVPEVELARIAKKRKNYKFILSDKELGVTTRKRVNSQINSVIRTCFPTLQKSLSLTLFSLISVTLLTVLPALILTQQFLVDQELNYMIIGALVIFAFSHMITMTATNPNSWWLSMFNLPLAVALQLISLVWSMASYEFGSVEWKGRNICIPVLSSKTGIASRTRA